MKAIYGPSPSRRTTVILGKPDLQGEIIQSRIPLTRIRMKATQIPFSLEKRGNGRVFNVLENLTKPPNRDKKSKSFHTITLSAGIISPLDFPDNVSFIRVLNFA